MRVFYIDCVYDSEMLLVLGTIDMFALVEITCCLEIDGADLQLKIQEAGGLSETKPCEKA